MIPLEGDGEGISARALTWERNELPLQVAPWKEKLEKRFEMPPI
jgi:hypothetical protein